MHKEFNPSSLEDDTILSYVSKTSLRLPHIRERQQHVSLLPRPIGNTRQQTTRPVFCSLMLQPLNHTSFGARFNSDRTEARPIEASWQVSKDSRPSHRNGRVIQLGPEGHGWNTIHLVWCANCLLERRPKAFMVRLGVLRTSTVRVRDCNNYQDEVAMAAAGTG